MLLWVLSVFGETGVPCEDESRLLWIQELELEEQEGHGVSCLGLAFHYCCDLG